MVKGCSLLIVGFMLLLAVPICIGIGGGIFGIVVGLIGGLFGLIFGLIGAVIGMIAKIFGAITHALFGWGHHGFHLWHFNGFVVLALIILIFVIARGKKN